VPARPAPHADPDRCAGQSRPCERKVEGKENHCHYLRRGRAEEMAGAVQGNLPTEMILARNPRGWDAPRAMAHRGGERATRVRNALARRPARFSRAATAEKLRTVTIVSHQENV